MAEFIFTVKKDFIQTLIRYLLHPALDIHILRKESVRALQTLPVIVLTSRIEDAITARLFAST